MRIRRVIGGKAYDTEKAIQVAVVVDQLGHSSDFHAERTALYRTQKGAWFLAGEGGGCSRWKRDMGDRSFCPGSGIELINAHEAQRLLEQVNGPVEKYFEIEEG
jgi:hypothetical protein